MNSWAFATPVLPGQAQVLTKEIAEHLRANMDEVGESYRHAGITLDRGYLQPTPMGDFYIQYNEATVPFEESLTSWRTSGLDIDAYTVERFGEITGVDIAHAELPVPEPVWSYVDESAPRARGLAFCMPVPTENLQKARDFFGEAQSQTQEQRASRERMGVTKDVAFLNVSPQGNVCCVYVEGADPVTANETFALSTDPYDTWFKAEAGAIFGIDFNQPLPPIEQVWEWPETTT